MPNGKDNDLVLRFNRYIIFLFFLLLIQKLVKGMLFNVVTEMKC